MSLRFRVRLYFERRRLDAEERVLAFLENHPWSGGYDIGKGAGMRSARVYPTLDRLMADGQVWDRWEPLQPGKKYRRRLYALAPEGISDPRKGGAQ